MARYELRNGKFILIDDKGVPVPGAKEYTRDYKSGSGLLGNAYGLSGTPDYKHLGGHAGTGGDLDKFILTYLNEGRILTKDEYGKRQGAYDNMLKDLETFSSKELGTSVSEYVSKFEQGDLEDIYGVDPGTIPGDGNRIYEPMDDLFAFDQEGSLGNQLFNVYRDVNQGQYESALINQQYDERDMNRMLSGERQQLMDQIREDRRRMLKSGLSQSAIANREIQGLLQSQMAASNIGEQMLYDRRQANQMSGNIDAMSRAQVIDAYGQGGIGNVWGASQAAGAGDFITSYLKQRGLNSGDQRGFEKYLKDTQGN